MAEIVNKGPNVDWSDMQPGQIAWQVAPIPGGWRVSRIFGAEALSPETDPTQKEPKA